MGGSSKEERAWQMCRQYIDRRVSGVFFAPLEEALHQDDVNLRIVEALDAARIPVVLLDRPALPYPRRGHHDLVGIDNRRAGYMITEHLTSLGSRRVAFVAVPQAAATVDAREAGYREALYAANLRDRARARRAARSVRRPLPWRSSCAPRAPTPWSARTTVPPRGSCRRCFVSATPSLADVRLVGIDDVEYAGLLPVPLTTLRQPTQQIGDVALGVMLERVARTDFPRGTCCSTASWSSGIVRK